ncbi:MAG TPA: WhiB family transcriptional regulator [Jatrophihabitantaceae bacterium]|jgi:WhiB family redox-sensing transcriptional regulator|nr:WhiB family transcriptional regulator [Jatrophihabitantaceae bacterium]
MASTERYDRPRRIYAWEWQLDAACAGLDTALFYQADNERGSSVRLREKKAKAICARCPVITNCLKDALANNEPFGVWGGMSADERYRLINNLGA